MKYLDPKADLTFKKVFGEHPDLVISLLNALLPLNQDETIQSIEYLPSEIIPDDPLHKDSIVDVRCKDQSGRQFIVEMQMVWTLDYNQRVLFNAAKTYVRQLPKGHNYNKLKPVYSLNLLNTIVEKDLPDYYHHYQLIHDKHTDKVIDGLQLVFVELPKFKPQTITEKKMQALWLRFLTEIDEDTKTAPTELLGNPDVKKALDMVEESAFTPQQLAEYDGFQDWLRRQRAWEIWKKDLQTKAQQAEKKAKEAEERKEEAEKKAKEAEEKLLNSAKETAQKMKAKGYPIKDIMDITGLNAQQIEEI